MTSAQALSKFDILLDKYGSPYFEESEKLEFLNMAQNEVLNRFVPDSLGGVVNFELDQNTFHNIRNLVWSLDLAASSTSGDSSIFTTTSINSELVTRTSDSSTSLFRVLSLSIDVGSSSTGFIETGIKFSKVNNFAKSTSNFFKKASQSAPIYTYESTYFRVLPRVTSFVRFRVIKTPKVMTSGNSPDWDDYVMNQVILQAVKLAGVPLRDEEIQQDVRLTGFQSAQ